MHSIQVKNFPEESYMRLKDLAKADKRSIQQEAAWLLEQAIEMFGKFHHTDWSRANRVQEEMRLRYGVLPDSSKTIRDLRDQG